MKRKHFRLYEGCVPVKGANRSIILDLQRSNSHFIPNDLYDVIVDLKTNNIDDLLNKYEDEDKVTINEYFDFLISNDYGFYLEEEELELFPETDFGFQTPFEI